jgi:hypothetical protein
MSETFLNPVTQYPPEVQVQILSKLSDDALLEICEAETTLEVCENPSL